MPAFVWALFIKSSTNVELSYYMRNGPAEDDMLTISGHVFDQTGCHSLWRILDVFLSEFLYKLCIHGLNSSLSVNKFSMIQTGRKIKQSGI